MDIHIHSKPGNISLGGNNNVYLNFTPSLLSLVASSPNGRIGSRVSSGTFRPSVLPTGNRTCDSTYAKNTNKNIKNMNKTSTIRDRGRRKHAQRIRPRRGPQLPVTKRKRFSGLTTVPHTPNRRQVIRRTRVIAARSNFAFNIATKLLQIETWLLLTVTTYRNW